MARNRCGRMMFLTSSVSCVLLLVLVLLLGGTAAADATTYSTFAAWAAATSGQNYVDLSTYVPENGWQQYAGGFTAGGITFSNNGGSLAVFDDGFSSWGDLNHGVGPESVNAFYYPPDPRYNGIMMSFTGLTALGFNVAEVNNYPVVITLSNGQTFTVTPPAGSYVFFGFTSDDPITSIQVTGLYNENPLVGSIYTGTAGAAPDGQVPEPASLWLLGSGLGMMGTMLRRRR